MKALLAILFVMFGGYGALRLHHEVSQSAGHVDSSQLHERANCMRAFETAAEQEGIDEASLYYLIEEHCPSLGD